MTSREKVHKMFNREPFDGMVIDIGGMYSDGIAAEAYAKLLKHIGMEDEEIKVFDVSQQLAWVSPRVVEYLGGDFVLAHRMRLRYGISCKEWKEDSLPGGIRCLVPSELNPKTDEKGNKNIYAEGTLVSRMPKDGHYYDQIVHVLEDADSVDDIEKFQFEKFLDDEVDYIADMVEQLYTDTDKAIVFGFGATIFEQGQADFNFENFYANLLTEPEMMHRYFEKLTETYIYDLEQVLGRVGDKIDAIHFRDDLGTQIALQISAETYRTMIKPYHRRMFQYVHDNYPNVRCLLHSCGAIFDLILDLIDAGVDCLNPVQTSARGMDPKRLKETYGDQIIFWGGGADLQQFVQNHEPEEIRRHVEENLSVLKEGGGYVFTQVHNFQCDTPPEKILAIYETAKKYKDADADGQ